MVNEVLTQYYDKPPVVHLIEDADVDEEHELHYYLLGYSTEEKSSYVVIVQNGYEYDDFITKTTELLKEHAGVTVTNWHVLNAAKSAVGTDVLRSDEAFTNLDRLLYESEADAESCFYALVDVTLDFDVNVYKNTSRPDHTS